MINTRSQALQDIFAYSVLGPNNTYIEVGANHPYKHSNTYELEVTHGYKGFSLELNESKWRNRWQHHAERKNKIYWDNAITFNYLDAVKNNEMLNEVGYLSIDIEPPSNTFAALQTVINSGITFKCITFEHDAYQSSDVDYNSISKDFLKSNGYKVAVKNVYYDNPLNHFETWFVRNDIEFQEMEFEDWKLKIKDAYQGIQFV
jgi:hypothetical protein